jgi:23S rRNA pseudouridine1911/1915/1917 synthase
MERRLDLQVDLGDVGERVDRFVAARVRSLSRTFVAGLVAGGRVLVDGEPARRAAQRVQKPGRVVVLIAPRAEEPEASLEGRVLLLDDALIAIDKPSGLPVSARLRLAGEDAIQATRRLLQARGLDASFLGNPHRLDKDTSGVLLLARTREAARALSRSFARGETRKTYLAWVQGVPERISGTIEARVHAPGDGEARIDERGRPARTRFRVVRSEGGRALLLLALLTGRTHQLRLHLAHVGTPIEGDRIYGTPSGRLLLHARKLACPHPVTGARIVLKAPPGFAVR